jgi:hypothetical protein
MSVIEYTRLRYLRMLKKLGIFWVSCCLRASSSTVFNPPSWQIQTRSWVRIPTISASFLNYEFETNCLKICRPSLLINEGLKAYFCASNTCCMPRFVLCLIVAR